jgi:PIN domain nuclease of toxin-antitoxin system
VIVLDAYALVAYFRDEPAAEEVSVLLFSPCVVSALNAAEVVDRLVRVGGHDADDVEADLALLSRHDGMRVAPVTTDVAMLAARLRVRHYHKEHAALSLADCVAAATALSMKGPMATADPSLAGLIRAEGGELHALPDTKGRLP